MPVLKLELRDDDGGLINARSREGRAESGACDECVHVCVLCCVFCRLCRYVTLECVYGY